MQLFSAPEARGPQEKGLGTRLNLCYDANFGINEWTGSGGKVMAVSFKEW